MVADPRGDVEPSPGRAHGLFCDDTRFLSRWRLTLDGCELDVLSVADLEYYAVEFFLVPRIETVYENPHVSIVRRRVVRGTWTEEIGVLNHRDAAIEVALVVEADTDFADLFEVKDDDVARRDIDRRARGRELRLAYHREGFARETLITTDDAGWRATPAGFRARLTLGPHEERWSSLHVVARSEQRSVVPPRRTSARSFDETRATMRADLDAWFAQAPALEADWPALEAAYRRSLVDLAALRFYPGILPGASLPAAGLPWFMALFGRDSLIASYQALPMQPDQARTTLLALAALQAEAVDDRRDAEPGKILHELRFGERTELGQTPHSPYYGSADATPLFLVVLDEYERWTGDTDVARRLEPHARAALGWIDSHGDLDGDGYVEYRTRNPVAGLENQCWKDSWNSMLFADGTRAEPPIASCEIQGYVFDAKRRCARLAREVWGDLALADRLEREAAELRARFHRDFWVPDRGFYALALDRDKRRVDSLTSNVGHLLWSGIVDAEPADRLAEHLLGDRLFSGWGVRTMAVGEVGHNPLEYHNGTVWPHDSSLIAHGLAGYGHREKAARIATALVEAGAFFAHRLPEVFAGYARELTQFPVEYPTASRPQAWATGAPLLAIRTLLGLEPSRDGPVVTGRLPAGVGRLALRDVPGRWGRADAELGAGDVPVA